MKECTANGSKQSLTIVSLCKVILIIIIYMYYLKHEHECFIRYKTRGAAERFISDKARIIPILSLCLRKNFEYRCCISRENRGKSFVKIYVCFITYKDSFTAMIFFVFCS